MASPSLIERFRGKRTADIELPNESGEVDDRILADEESRTWNPLKRLAIRVQRVKQRTPKRSMRR
jgi:hypothetical protein